jgi:hypothetical protein
MAGQGSTAAQHALTEQDVTAVREEVSAGRTVTVWFTTAAVGVQAGGSAKVVAVGDVAEADFIQVRPAGSRDAVFCSPNELTRNRPARRPAKPRQQAVPAADDTTAPPETPARPVRAPRSARSSAPAAPSTSSLDLPGPEEAVPEKPTPAKPGRAASAPTRKRGEHSGALTVSLTSTAGGDWTVEVLVGARRVVSSTPVQATEVAALSRSLPPAVAEVITSSLVEARRRQQERVAQLREELDAAQRTLEQLGVD